MLVGDIHTDKGFFIGDISYVTRSSVYDDVWGRKYSYKDGVFSAPVHANSKEFYNFIVTEPKAGQGVYFDEDGIFRFEVKCSIGVLPIELMKVGLQKKEFLVEGLIVHTEGDAHIEINDKGVLDIKLPKNSSYPHHTHIVIDTKKVDDYIFYPEDEDFVP